jgi:hypothetical protein
VTVADPQCPTIANPVRPRRVAGGTRALPEEIVVVPVRFDKRKAEYYLERLIRDEPIAPQDKAGWTGNECLLLAGVLEFLLRSRGEILGFELAKNAADPRLPRAFRKMCAGFYANGLSAALDWVSARAKEVSDGTYDDHYEPECAADLDADRDGLVVTPIAGFKDPDDAADVM